MEFVFKQGTNYKKAFVDYISTLFEQVEQFTEIQRVQLANELIESYFTVAGAVPDSMQLSRLSSFILHDMLKDKDPHKASKTGVLSDRQIRRREQEKEGAFVLAGTYGTDGVKHGTGRRNTRTNQIE